VKNLITILTTLLLATTFSCTQKPDKQEHAADFRFEEYTITQLQQGYDNGDFTVTDPFAFGFL